MTRLSVLSGVVALAIFLGLALFVALIVRHPDGLVRWGSTVAIFVNHVRTREPPTCEAPNSAALSALFLSHLSRSVACVCVAQVQTVTVIGGLGLEVPRLVRDLADLFEPARLPVAICLLRDPDVAQHVSWSIVLGYCATILLVLLGLLSCQSLARLAGYTRRADLLEQVIAIRPMTHLISPNEP